MDISLYISFYCRINVILAVSSKSDFKVITPVFASTRATTLLVRLGLHRVPPCPAVIFEDRPALRISSLSTCGHNIPPNRVVYPKALLILQWSIFTAQRRVHDHDVAICLALAQVRWRVLGPAHEQKGNVCSSHHLCRLSKLEANQSSVWNNNIQWLTHC